MQQLLIDQDETFIKQLEYLNSDQFQKETDRGYLRRNLHFFMAIILQGIQSPTDKKYIENFLYIIDTFNLWDIEIFNFGNEKIKTHKACLKFMEEN